MTTILATSSTAGTTVLTAPRVVSIDIFRGLTMAVMIFVNQLSGVPGLPWWTYHAHAQQELMTYVDMVFPFFLFSVGMSMPLSVAQRLKRNPSFQHYGVMLCCACLAYLSWDLFWRMQKPAIRPKCT